MRQLAKRMGQLSDEIRGLQSQQSGRDRQAVLIEEELLGVRDLYAKNLVSLSRKTLLEPESASLEGQKGSSSQLSRRSKARLPSRSS
jgi:HlyD family secretion protein